MGEQHGLLPSCLTGLRRDVNVAKIVIMRDKQVIQEVELDKDRMTLGRKVHNDIVIAHAAVSGEHAVLTLMMDGVCLEDQGSTNGTYLNGQRISRCMLEDHDVVTLGKCQFEFHAGPRAPKSVTPAGAGATIATISVRTGPNAGKVLSLDKPVSTLGRPGVQVAAITRQGDAYFFSHVDGQRAPLVNGRPVGKTAQRLADGDAIELAGVNMVFAHTAG